MTSIVDDARFHVDFGRVPRKAKKVGGSYQADGWVVAEFYTRKGSLRYVFEFETPAGMLHIFGPEQVVFV